MKPKPFWLLNHFTVPLFMGVFLLIRACSSRAMTQPVSSRFGEGRQSGALFAARPSRSAETRCTIHGYRTPQPQGGKFLKFTFANRTGTVAHSFGSIGVQGRQNFRAFDYSGASGSNAPAYLKSSPRCSTTTRRSTSPFRKALRNT